jgi:pyruvate/2-oxoglutarate dehydrogenase complex dihydrolipoamide dehydrogenase (E3) component
MVVDEDNGYLLGATFVGPGVEELLHSATIAVAGQVPVARLWHAVPAFRPSARSGSGCWNG